MKEWNGYSIDKNMHGYFDSLWTINPINNNVKGIKILFEKIEELERRIEELENT